MAKINYQLSSRYTKKRAFITGGGSGLGKVLSTELASNGWTIGIADINAEGLKETATMIEKNGGKAFTYLLDVANSDQYESVSKEFLKDVGGIDLLINNAGVGDGSVFEEYSPENWRWIVGINQMGVVYGCHYFVPVMKKQKSGHIITISSAASFMNLPSMSSYNVTKAAVLSLSETLYTELKGDRIDVSVVCPTFFKTNVMQHSRGNKAQTSAGQKMVDRSGIEPIEVAQTILKEAGNKTFYIIHPFSAKVLFSLKRYFPKFLLGQIAKRYNGMQAKAAKKQGT